MAVTCTLGSLDLSPYLIGEPRVGGATRQWDEVGGSHADIAKQSNVRTSALIEIVLPLKMTAATADLLIAAVASVRTEAKKDTNTLTVKPTGATNSSVFNIVKSPHIVPKWDGAYDVGKLAVFDLVLIAEPWAYASSATTAINATNVTLPDGLSFKAAAGDATTITGDVDTPLTITLAPNSDADMTDVYMGWYPAADWTAYLVETDVAGTWVGGTCADAALDYEHATASVKNTGTDYAYFPIDTAAAYADGSYLVVARVAMEESDDTGYLKLSTAAGDITDEVAWDAATDGKWELVPIGVVHLPVLDTITGTAATLRVSMKCSAARYIAMDYVAFVPIDHGLFAYAPTTGDAALLKSELGKVYVDSIVTYSGVSGHGIKAHGLGTLVVLAEHASPNAATYAGTITVAYTPRYELWR